jgi:hypothetical protein
MNDPALPSTPPGGSCPVSDACVPIIQMMKARGMALGDEHEQASRSLVARGDVMALSNDGVSHIFDRGSPNSLTHRLPPGPYS